MTKPLIFAALLMSVFISPVFADYLDDSRLQAILRTVSAPRLIYPSDEVIDISAKDTVDFHWALYSTTLVARNRIEFRLFKGDRQSEADLILTKELSPETLSLKVSAALLEDGKAYTWSITQYILRSEGHEASAAHFKVVKRNNNANPVQ